MNERFLPLLSIFFCFFAAHSEFFWIKVKWFSEFYFTAKFWSFKLKKPFRMAGGEKKSEPPFFCPPFLSTWKNHPWYYFVKLFCSKGFTTFLPVCKKHTRDAEIRPFGSGFCLKSLSFLSFSERCKNQGSFCKCFIINKVLFLYRTCARGKLRKRSVFLSAPIFVWDNLPSKFLPCKLTFWGEEVKMLASSNGLLGFLPTFYPQKSSILTEVVGEDKKTLTIFSTLAKNSVKFFSQNRFTRAFSVLFAT